MSAPVVGGGQMDRDGPDGAVEVPMVEVVDLVRHFPVRAGLLRRQVGVVHALDGVSLTVARGETLGIVGESGSGKSTLGRCLLRLVEPTSGTVRIGGRDLTAAPPTELRQLRRRIQMVFQDPYGSLNPRLPVRDSVAEPLVVHGTSRAEAYTRVGELLEAVGLSSAHGRRYPHELSGGQRQRIGIARALAPRPDVVVLDEPVSALDVSVQAQVLNLLQDLRGALDLTFLFIAHDLSVVRHVSDRVAVLYLGVVVEQASAARLHEAPAHPYTHALRSAIPVPDPVVERGRTRVVLRGELPSPTDPPSGCRFRTRCPIATDRCRDEVPVLREVAPGQTVACHFPLGPGERLPA